MISLVSKNDFTKIKREALLDHDAYHEEAEDFLTRIPRAAKKLSDPEWREGREIDDFWRLTEARAEYALDLLTLSYSAGVDIRSLKDFFPKVLDYFEEYALYSEALNETPEGIRNPGPHIAICDVEFDRANRLLCFAILLGYQRAIPRIMAIIDYNNPMRDGMLERLAARYVERVGPMPVDCTRHLPYYKTLAIFSASEEKRAELMREYLADWYEASRREPYYGAHDIGNQFLGYWSWEAAAITIALDIDDRTYKDVLFYPRDMVDFAKQNASDGKDDVGAIPVDVRAKAGEKCPVEGFWQSIGVPAQRVHYEQGAELRDLRSPYGLTVWRLMQE